LNPPAREEIRELARGLRHTLEALDDAGFVGLSRDAVVPDSRDALAQGEPQRVEPTQESMSPSTTRSLPFRSSSDDETRRSLPSERGEVRRSEAEKRAALDAIAAKVDGCQRCGLCRGRTHAVPGEGSARARVLFVGEGPGATEDEQGRPFVGRAGQLLTKIIESGMGLRREDVFIANIVKCRPPENRDPLPEEVAACVPFLNKQIEVLDPEVIIPLGRHSMRELAGVSERDTISRVRGKVYRVHGRAVIPTFHPAYLLRNPPEKVKVWNDIQLAMKELGLPLPPTRSASGNET
jgi:uracil-DNA glycosylase